MCYIAFKLSSMVFKIRARLLMAYLVSTLFTLLVAAAGFAGVYAMHGRSSAMFGNVVEPLTLLERMNGDFLSLRITLRDLILNPALRNDAKTLGKIDDLTQNFYRVSGTMVSTIITEETRESFDEFQDGMRIYLGDSKTFLDLISEGREAESLELLNGEMKVSSDEAQNALTDLIERTRAIGDEYSRANSSSLKTVLAAFLGLLSVAILASMAIAFSMARYFNGTLSLISGVLANMSRGNMMNRFDSRHLALTDEFGDLVRSADKLQIDLQEQIRNLIEASDGLDSIGSQMLHGSAANAQALSVILNSVAKVEGAGFELAERVSNAAGTTTQILERITRLDSEIQNQAAGINESAASIEQMESNIQSVKRSSENLGQEFSSLSSAAEDGKQKLAIMESTIRRIDEQSARLFEANQIVKSIAARTNLLAMNAAIEAAHAGDAGRGFAVVADEIRNLAEQSGSQAGSISRDIKEIKTEIDQVVTHADTANMAFSTVMEKIGTLGRLESEISHSMQEQAQGASQITQAIYEINEVTVRIRDSSREITEGSRSIQGDMSILRALGDRLKENLSDIEGGTSEIRRTTDSMQDSGGKNAGLVKTLRTMVNRFQV